MVIACLFKWFILMWTAPLTSLTATNFESLNYKTETYRPNADDKMDEDHTLQGHYLQLPVFLHSRHPLVEKEIFSPKLGGVDERLPGKVRDVLFPTVPTWNPTTPIRSNGVVTRCNAYKVRVQVHRAILGVVDLSSHFPIHLGTCKASQSTKESVYFEYGLGECGSKRTRINNRMAYTNILRYDPPERSGLIRRAVPFTLPVVCHYNRYQYSYKIGYTPTVKTQNIFKSMRHRVDFILTPRNAQWERLPPEHQFEIGKPMYFEAEALSISQDERLYVQFCHVTLMKSHNSTPQFPVVENFGCMVESKNGHSRFIPYKQNVVRFTVDAFLFKALPGQQLYMHCKISKGGPAPSTTAKSCNYDTKAGRWQELYGSASACSCCDSTCISTAPRGETRPKLTKMISSKPWTIANMTKTTPAQKKHAGKTTVATTTQTMAKIIKNPPSSQPEDKQTSTFEEEAGSNLEWPFGGRGVQWVEEGGVKGSAVVEEENITPPRRIFEEVFGLDR